MAKKSTTVKNVKEVKVVKVAKEVAKEVKEVKTPAIRKDLKTIDGDMLKKLFDIVNVSLDGIKNNFELASKTLKEVNESIEKLNLEYGTEFSTVAMTCVIFREKKTKEKKATKGYTADCFDKNYDYKGVFLKAYGVKLKINFKEGKNVITLVNKLGKSYGAEENTRLRIHKNAETGYCKALNIDTITEKRCQEKIAFGLFKNLETYINQVKNACEYNG